VNARLTCIDAGNNPTDWWFMLKMPDVVGDYKGNTYLYLDSNGNSSKGTIQDSNHALALTVYQIGLYGTNVDTNSVGYVLWNDQTYDQVGGETINHEQDPSGVYYAHSKATIGFDSSTGFWLAHSAPGFPYSHSITPSSWAFPEAQTVYAQHFFCLSIQTSSIPQISQFLMNYYAYIYDYNVPASIPGLSAFSTLVAGKYTTSHSSIQFSSSGGLSITAFGKHGATNSDMYEDYIAPGLNSGLWVESWCCGTYGDCCQLSYCQGTPISDPSGPQQGQNTYAFNSIDLEKFSFASNLYYTTANNHAKFALSQTGGYVCPSDNNRADSQRERGGGALCFQNPSLYNFLYSHVTGFNTTCS
jgi:deoxyribonuclease-2